MLSAWLVGTLFASWVHAAPVQADVVTSFHEALLTAIRADSYEERLGIVAPAVAECFQVHTIARISLGRHWQTLSAEDQNGYQQLLQDLIASTWAARFKTDTVSNSVSKATETITPGRERVRSILETARKR